MVRKIRPVKKAFIFDWAKRLGIIVEGSTAKELRDTVQKRLAYQYAEERLLTCSRCGFKAPDTLEIPSCPGCGLVFGSKTEGKNMTNAINLLNKSRLKAEEKIDMLKTEISSNFWEIGTQLNTILHRNLWKEGGDYKGFGDYVNDRFGFTRQNAKMLILVAETFTKRDAALVPSTHLQLLAKIPDEAERKKLLEEVKTHNLTTKNLAAKVKVEREAQNLETQRRHHEGTVLITARVKPGKGGKIGEPAWATRAGKRILTIELGDHFLVIEDQRTKAIVRLKDKAE